MFKIINTLILSDTHLDMHRDMNRPSRTPLDIKQPRSNSTFYGLNSVLVTSIRTYNCLPVQVKTLVQTVSFKKQAKEFFLNHFFSL